MQKKLYLVKREVLASSIEQALKSKGKVYEVSLADDSEIKKENKKIGFSNK